MNNLYFQNASLFNLRYGGFHHLFESGSKAHKKQNKHIDRRIKTDTQKKKDGDDRHNKTPSTSFVFVLVGLSVSRITQKLSLNFREFFWDGW